MIRFLLKLITSPLRVFRWNYVAPRLVLLFVLLCVSELGVGWFAHWSVESQGSAAVGAVVDVAQVQASLINTRVTFTDVEVANPDAPMTNLFSAERLELDFDTAAALRKKAVVDHGVLSGLRLGGERETSGQLESSDGTPPAAATSLPAWAGSTASQKTEQWLADLESRLSADATSGFQSPALAEQLEAEWPERVTQLRESAGNLEQRIASFESLLRETQKNPLRGVDVLRRARGEVAELTAEATQLRQQIAQLPQQATADRQRIADAREHDEQLIRERLSLDNLDPESVTAYLLGEQVGGPIAKLVDTLRWARTLMPAGDDSQGPMASTRGVDVLFNGSRPLPSLLVKRLDITGAGLVADRPIEFTGALTNLTTQPVLHGEPAKLQIAATGALPFDVTATMDRTGLQPRDTIVANCPAMPVPAIRLGAAGGFSLESLPSTAALAMNLTLDSDTLNGSLRIVQDQLAFRSTGAATPSSLQKAITESLVSSLSQTPRVETTVRIRGELDSPSYALESTLGSTFVVAIRNAVRHAAQSQSKALLAGSRRRLDEQAAKINEMVASVTADLNEQLAEQSGLLSKLTKIASPAPLGGGVFGIGSLPKPLAR